MGTLDDPFRVLAAEAPAGDFSALQAREVRAPLVEMPPVAAVVARLHGFDLLDQPIVKELPQWPGQLVVALAAVPLRRSMAGSRVVVVFEGGDALKPIIIGAVRDRAVEAEDALSRAAVADVDGERHVIRAEREIVLRCGDASITLTRAGKIVIQGTYILSRSSGCNKIKGAAVDIN